MLGAFVGIVLPLPRWAAGGRIRRCHLRVRALQHGRLDR